MARRLPGKRVRDEYFSVDGVGINVELRLMDDGHFYMQVDDETRFEAPSLSELRSQVKPYLEETRRLVFDPFIDVQFNDEAESSRYTNLKDRLFHQEVVLDFKAGWLSRTVADRQYRWIEVYVDERTCEPKPLTDQDRSRRYGERSARELIPFTPDRWRKLCSIAAALADVRGKIAAVLSDASGAKLEALTLLKLLEASPAKKRTR